MRRLRYSSKRETQSRPKPMVEIGDRPILWHIMNIYSVYGYNDFVLAAGYKGEMIKQYFLNYHKMSNDLTVSLKTGKVSVSKKCWRDWAVSIYDSGSNTMTGGRLLRLKNILKSDTFMMTYGDGVCDIDIRKLVSFHKKHGKLATVTAVRPIARFGGMDIKNDKVMEFKEKPQSEAGWINGGFFVFEPEIMSYLSDDNTVLEKEPLEELSAEGQLMAYKHEGFWQCMDTLRDKFLLEKLWNSNAAPWKVWK